MNVNLIELITRAALMGALEKPNDKEAATSIALRVLTDTYVRQSFRGPEHLYHLLEAVSRKHGLDVEDVRGPHRQKPLVNARWEFIAHAREEGHSLPTIGAAINRDHTTVMHALREMRASND